MAGLVIFILGITGSVLVFHEEIEKQEQKEFLSVAGSGKADLDKAFQTISKTYKNWEVRIERFSADPHQTFVFGLRRPTERLLVFVHPVSGKILNVIDSEKSFTKVLLKLHYSLYAKTAGKTIVFVTGLIYLTSLISGLIIYRRSLLKVFLFRVKFKHAHPRSLASSLHRYVGVWALIINLAIVISGAFISFDVMSNGFKSSRKAEKPLTPVVNISLEKTIAVIEQTKPGLKLNYIRMPKKEGAPVLFLGCTNSQPFYYSHTANSVAVDPLTGQIQEIKMAENMKGMDKVSGIAKTIHFVEFAGLITKILFCLAGLSVPLLSITGFLLWKLKSKKTLKPAMV